MRLPSFTPLVFAAFALLATSCSYNLVRGSSPLRDKVRFSPVNSPEDARRYILSELPIGSSEAEVRAFAKTHTRAGFRTEHDLPSVPGWPEPETYLCLRVKYRGGLVSSNWTEIVFLLDEDRTLKDVVVDRYGVAL